MSTPLNKAVDEYVNKGLSRFHMPGHKGAECFPDYYKYDITEVAGADSLFEASGAIREAEERFAAIYGAGASLLSAGGSTLCIQGMLATFINPGDTVIMCRNCHASAVNAAALLDLNIVWVNPRSHTELSAALEQNPAAKAVYVTSPDYFGVLTDIASCSKLAHEHGALFILDAAQTAGTEKYDMEQSGIDFICAPGHKGLLGPTGTGILVTKKPKILKPLIFGGTGSYSLDFAQPPDMPERMESGTLNVPGICGLSAGIEKVSAEGESTISEREMQLAQMIYAELSSTKNVTLFTPPPKAATSAAVISFVISDLTGEQTAAELAARGAATRGGFHCAALAHRKFGTEKRGTCRISIGPMNTFDEALKLVRIIHTVAKEN